MDDTINWLFLDLNAYFASVEQQVTPALRGKPVAVVPMKTDNTCCIAASYEAKAYGIKTGTRVGDAKKMCPTLNLVEALPQLYVRYHHMIVDTVGSLIPIESAGAIAATERAYESFDVPKGTLRGAPPVPDADVTTLRTNLYLVAGKALGADLVTTLTQTILSVRRDLMHEEPIFAQITAPSTDQDAYLPLHRGAAAVYNSTTQSFMDEYGNWIYLTPMLLGGIATVLAAGWKFLGIGNPATREGPLDSLYALGRRIRNALTEAELLHIEDEIDDILKLQREKSASGDENAVDDATLNVAAHRLESLIHDRRTTIGKRPVLAPAA